MCYTSSAERTFSCTHSGQYDCWKHIKSRFHKNNAEQVSASGNVRAFFTIKEKLSKDNVKWRVMAASVKMCEMIAELNLPLATANSLRNILIGRELTNFHCHYYYGFVVYTCYAALHTQFLLLGYCPEAWRWRLCPWIKLKSPPHLLNFCWVHMLYHAHSCPYFHCIVSCFGWCSKGVLHKLHFLVWGYTFLLVEVLQILVRG